MANDPYHKPHKQRRDEILTAALTIAKRKGLNNVMRKDVATKAKTAEGNISAIFANMDNLKKDVMRLAIEKEELALIAEGVVLRDRIALKANRDLRKKALLHYAVNQ